VQTVHGSGFSFQAPAAWAIVRKSNSVAAVNGPVDRVEVLRFALEKPYRPELFAAVSRELDSVADRLAGQLSGRVAERTTSDVAGRNVRSYRIDYGPGKTQEIAFVLDGRDEFQVLCRRPADAADATCAQLFSTFALG
jgi:hypothetical protein